MGMDVQQQLNHAKSLSQRKQYNEAKQILMQLHDTDSTNLDIIRGLGRVCRYLDQDDEALGYYQTFTTINPSNHEIYRRMAYIYDDSNQYKEAEQMYRKSLSIAPYNMVCLKSLAKLKEKQKKYDEAKKIYQEAITCDPDDAQIHFYYGQLLFNHLHDISSAQIAFKKAVSLQPDEDKYNIQYNKCLNLINSQQQQKLDQFIFDRTNHHLIKVIIYNFDDLIVCNNKKCYDEMIDLSDMNHNMNDHDRVRIFGGRDRIERICSHFQQLTMQRNMKLGLWTKYHPNLVINYLQQINCCMFFDGGKSIFSDRFEQIESFYCNLKRDNVLFVDTESNQNNLWSATNYAQILIIKQPLEIPGLTLIDLEYIEVDIFNISELPHNKPRNPRTYHRNLFNYPFSVPNSMRNQNQIVYDAIKIECGGRNIQCVQQLTVFNYIQNDSHNFIEFKDCFIDFAWKYFDMCCAMNKNDWWIAANFLTQLINMEKNDYELHAKYAKALSYLKLNTFATKHYEMALQFNENSSSTHESYARHLLYTRNYQQAMQHFEFCIKEITETQNKRVTNANFLNAYSRAADFANHGDIAEKYYKLSLQMDNQRKPKTSARYHANYGQFLFKNQRLSEAEKQYQNAIQLDSTNAYTYHKLSNVLFKMDRFEEHVTPLKKSLEINPNYYPALRDYQRYFSEEYKQYNETNEEKKEEIYNNYNNNNDNNNNYNNNNYNNNNCNNNNNTRNMYTSNTSNSSQSIYDRSAMSATSTTLSKLHTKNKFQNEFNRLYWNEFSKQSEDKEKFKVYLVKMMLAELNDIRVILKFDKKELKKQIRVLIKNMNTNDLTRICDLFCNIKHENQLFTSWLKVNEINDIVRKQIFDENAIYTFDALTNIKNKNDLINLVSDNDMELRSGGNNELIDKLWQMMQQIPVDKPNHT